MSQQCYCCLTRCQSRRTRKQGHHPAEKTNEDSQMVVGVNLTVGALCAQHRWETQQGGIWVAALSTSREIPTQA
ncbi:hypothetical protein PAMP_023077 [Pampus punctatissimus]